MPDKVRDHRSNYSFNSLGQQTPIRAIDIGNITPSPPSPLVMIGLIGWACFNNSHHFSVTLCCFTIILRVLHCVVFDVFQALKMQKLSRCPKPVWFYDTWSKSDSMTLPQTHWNYDLVCVIARQIALTVIFYSVDCVTVNQYRYFILCFSLISLLLVLIIKICGQIVFM